MNDIKKLWYVCGRRSNGTNWKSDKRHDTKEEAEEEMQWWTDNAYDTGEMNVWREIKKHERRIIKSRF